MPNLIAVTRTCYGCIVAAENKRAIGEANAITFLAEALSTHLAHAEAMRYVLNCLKTLAEKDGTAMWMVCIRMVYSAPYPRLTVRVWLACADKNFREEIRRKVVEDAILVRASHKDFKVIKAANRLLRLLQGTPALEMEESDSD